MRRPACEDYNNTILAFWRSHSPIDKLLSQPAHLPGALVWEPQRPDTSGLSRAHSCCLCKGTNEQVPFEIIDLSRRTIRLRGEHPLRVPRPARQPKLESKSWTDQAESILGCTCFLLGCTDRLSAPSIAMGHVAAPTGVSLPSSLAQARIPRLPATAYYIADFISEEEERLILDKVRTSPFPILPRRTA